MNKKKIFLASSSELVDDRRQFEIFINRKNKAWVDKGPEKSNAPASSIRIRHSKNVVAASSVNTSGGDFIIGDRNPPKK